MLAAELLARSGFAAQAMTTVDALVDAIDDCACVVVTEEALQQPARATIERALATQPAWSDLPVIVFAPRGHDRIADAFGAAKAFGNVTVLERPVQSRTLVSAVVAAVRARRRQYEARTEIERRDEFLAMLGHELRNPLAAIVLAVDQLARSTDAAIAKPRDILTRQSRHLSRLVDDLLDVARITRGKITLQRKRVDVREVVARGVQSAVELARARHIEVRLETGCVSCPVDGDAVRLEEIVLNLLSNAVKYSPEHTRVIVRLRCEDGFVVLEVVDQGIGIAPAMLGRVFDLFAQADETLDRSQGGLGIGLTVVKTLVELHGGRVEADSKGYGHGSTFRVRLPIAPPAVPPPAVEAAAPVESDLAGLRVLLVDDNLDLLDLMSELVTRLGCVPTATGDGQQAAELLVGQAFDVALLDVGLPGLDGYELAVRARALPTPPYLVAVTGYGQEGDRERARTAGFDTHLRKPVALATLRETLAVGRRLRYGSPKDP